MEISDEGLKRRKYLSVVLSEYEMRALEDIASQEIRKPQEVVRELIRQEAMRRNIWPPQPQRGGNNSKNNRLREKRFQLEKEE
ncbi:MAG: hypothetical protein QMD88_03100 [Coprothermobacterota bacterium]|nr:hypothetical protein [Coprothermobacterota bacterium]